MRNTRSRSRNQAQDARATEDLATKPSTSVKNTKRKITGDTAKIPGEPDTKIVAPSKG